MEKRKLGSSNLEAAAIGFGCMDENLGAAHVKLTREDLENIESALTRIEAVGDRYSAHLQKRVGR